MEYLAIIGTAYEVEPDYPEGPWLRLYRPHGEEKIIGATSYRKAGRTFMGYETYENVYLCSESCLNTWLNDWTMADNNGHAYLLSRDLARTGPGTMVKTADVMSAIDIDFDYPAKCEVCQYVEKAD